MTVGFGVLLGGFMVSWAFGYFVGRLWRTVETVTRDALSFN